MLQLNRSNLVLFLISDLKIKSKELDNMKIFLLLGLFAYTVLARPEDASSTTETIAQLEEDIDTDDDTTEVIPDDVHCEEVEKLKDYYCTTAHCKHFYSKHCYDIIEGVHPTCEKVRSCIESRVSKFRSKAEKHPDDNKAKSGSARTFISMTSLMPVVFTVILNAAKL